MISRFFSLILTVLMLSSNEALAENILCHPVNGDIEGLEIGAIKILNKNIFDPDNPEENSGIHIFGNKLHIQTRQSTIKKQLLIKPGLYYSQRLVNEAKRKLRLKKYIHAVNIYAEKVCDNKVFLVVKTTDNWTLTPSISFERSGGINRSSYEITESNFLGLGKSIVLKSASDEDRDTRFVRYDDDNLLGSNVKLSIKTADNSDGYLDSVLIGKPYFQLDSKYQFLLKTVREKKHIPTYDNGQITDYTEHQTDSISAEFGWSSGLQENQLFRYKIGWLSLEDQYFNVDNFPHTVLPEDSDKHFPYLGFEYLEDRYIQRENFNVMGVTEDIFIGNHLSAKAGLLDKSLGSSHDGYTLSANYAVGLDINPKTLAFVNLALTSEINQHSQDFNAVNINASLMYFQDRNHSYYMKAQYQDADNLLAINQYVIGGDSGLRGYPIRFQTGQTRVLMSVEKRSYFDWYPWKLVKFGVAFFADIGSAWQQDQQADFIKDIGFGLRLVSTRQSDAKVLHLDFAHPLDKLDEVDSFQLLVTAKSQF